jgi:hypothetical protein
MSTNYTAKARERSKLPVTDNIDHYVSWLNREIYAGNFASKTRSPSPECRSPFTADSRKPRSTARQPGCRLSIESPRGRGGCRMS